MLRVPVRSRLGNGVLGFLGVVYFVSATGLLIYYVLTTWGAMGLTDYALLFALIASGAGGLLFIAIAAQNLGLIGSHDAEKSHSGQTAAA